MRLLRIENFRHIDRNKAGGDAYLEYGDVEVRAEFIFYLQGNDCLNIRLGRHDTRVSTQELEDFTSRTSAFAKSDQTRGGKNPAGKKGKLKIFWC